MSREERPPDTNLLWRATRIVVPWVALIVVVLMTWSYVTQYRAAVDQVETTATVEPTATVGAVGEGEPYVEILSDGLNLRSEPSTTAGVVQVLDSGTRLAFIESGTGWYHVRTAGGVEGWVAAGGAYTKLVQP